MIYPEAIAKARAASRKFFELTNIWRSRAADLQSTSIVLLTTVAGQQLYGFTLPSGAELNQVHVAWNGRQEVVVDQPGDEEDDAPDCRDSSWRIAVEAVDTLRLSPAPSAGGVVVMGTVSYVPSIGAAGIPQPVFDRYKREIACGAAAMLAAQPGKPWSNPGAVQYLQDQFDEAVTRASNETGPVRRTSLRVRSW